MSTSDIAANRFGLPESIWANPHYRDNCTQQEKVERFEAYLKTRPDLLAQLHVLRQAAGLLVQAESVSRRRYSQTGRCIVILHTLRPRWRKKGFDWREGWG